VKEVLVVANRTLGGAKLLEAVRQRAAADGGARFRLVVPQSKPSAGYVIYDEAVRESAQVRVDLALEAVALDGIEGSGEVGDEDPFSATMDAVGEHRPDEIIVSTHPAESSGWLRRDLIERIRNATGLPVEHIVIDLEQEGLPFKVTLIVANKTSSGEELIEHLKALAAGEQQSLFIAVVPQLDGSGDAPRGACAPGEDARPPRRGGAAELRHDRRSRPLHGDAQRARAVPGRHRRDLDAPRRALRLAALEPDRARAQLDLGDGRARRRRPAGVPQRDVRRLAMEAASIAHAGAADHDHDEHHGPVPANRSSRVEPQLLGMMLFIISEIMVFGAFFTAYFFIRVAEGNPWPAPGTKLPVEVAGMNTAILVSSSFTLHWAEQCIKKGNRFGLKAGMLLTFLLGCSFLFIQINEYANIGFAPQDHAQQTIFFSLTGLHGAHVFIGLLLLLFVTVRAFRGHYSPEEHRGVEVPGIYWHFVDVMWLVVYFTVYIL
jgi:cytochrome c oxidase subunit 3